MAAFLDVCCVLLFVAIGRSSHEEAGGLAGMATTAWPFLAGLAAGWALLRVWRRPGPFALFPAGIGVWAVTVAVGMVLRVASGQGTAFSFIVVALTFLGLALLGWRLVARVLNSMRSSRDAFLPGR